MILCLDVGNSHIYGGVFEHDKLLLQFRYPSDLQCTSDQLGVFFKSILRENQLDPARIKQIAVCSVVPSLDYSLRASLIKYFSLQPFFLKAGVKTGLKIHYKNTHEVGADRIADSIAAMQLFPDKNIIVIDLGTATTFDIISKDHAYQGGVIIPGIHIAMKALNENTAKLPPVNILKPTGIIGQTTVSNIQAGLYYSHLGAMREIISMISREQFEKEKPVVIGTGGFANLFEAEDIFNVIIQDLVLQGLRLALQKNSEFDA
ncbi:MAG TPA: type III pantothenate kinase [Gammaproteobacteria bacterium]|nr:type III pantothenate kinase [Gammaproteobacteria bacterium]